MRTALRYGIVANPMSGNLPTNRRHALVNAAASTLSARIWGLGTMSAEELARCAREAAERCDVVVVAGGDGTMSLVINAIDLSATALAFLPFGNGNALTHFSTIGEVFRISPPGCAGAQFTIAISSIATAGKRRSWRPSASMAPPSAAMNAIDPWDIGD